MNLEKIEDNTLSFCYFVGLNLTKASYNFIHEIINLSPYLVPSKKSCMPQEIHYIVKLTKTF